MKASEIVYQILNELKSGAVSDDNVYSDRFILSLVNAYRAKLIRQDKSAGKLITGYYVQNLGEVELIKADKNECTIVSDCILRSKNPLPKAVDTSGTEMITYVGVLDWNLKFDRVSANTAHYSQFAKYVGKEPKYITLGDYLYVVNPPTNVLKYINVQGVFENPSEANSFRTCGNKIDCYTNLDYEYPLSLTISDAIRKLVIDEIKSGRVEARDTSNDTQNDN